MVSNQTIFKYITVKGPLHNWPALLKLILLLPFSFIAFKLTILWLTAGIFSIIILAFFCGISIKNQFTDLKPAFLYSLLMYLLSIFSNIFNSIPLHFNSYLLQIFIPHNDYLRICLRLIFIIQISALLFRTTSTLEIREVIKINTITLFLSFIPEFFEIWSKINLAWKARGGKNGVKKIKVVIFILISMSFDKAAMKARAFETRGGSL